MWSANHFVGISALRECIVVRDGSRQHLPTACTPCAQPDSLCAVRHIFYPGAKLVSVLVLCLLARPGRSATGAGTPTSSSCRPRTSSTRSSRRHALMLRGLICWAAWDPKRSAAASRTCHAVAPLRVPLEWAIRPTCSGPLDSVLVHGRPECTWYLSMRSPGSAYRASSGQRPALGGVSFF